MRSLPAALLALLIALPAAAPAPAPRFDGIWDLTWQTRHGPQQRGYFVLRRQGDRLEGEIHGQGSVRASGTVNGSVFQLRGSRMLVPYRIEGRVHGDRMEGELKILTVDRRFTGIRRP
jgi:hypothetical protein